MRLYFAILVWKNSQFFLNKTQKLYVQNHVLSSSPAREMFCFLKKSVTFTTNCFKLVTINKTANYEYEIITS
jgi:hypothetical protein